MFLLRYQLAIENSLMYQAVPVIDHLSSLEENLPLCLLRCPLKLSQKTRCTVLMYLGQEDCSPSTFGLFANGAEKLLNINHFTPKSD